MANPLRTSQTSTKRLLWVAGVAVAAAVCLVLRVPGSYGAIGHKLVTQISQAGAGSNLVEPGALAVDHASGDVFVADPRVGVIDVFSSGGKFLTAFGEQLEASGIAIDEANGNVYVAETASDTVDVFKPSGASYQQVSEWSGAATPGHSFGEVTGVAIDNSGSSSAGDVYVTDGFAQAVDIFKPQPAGPEEADEGTYAGVLGKAKLEEPNGVYVNAKTGEVYVADSALGLVYVYSPTGALEAKLTGSGSPQGKFYGPEAEEGNVTGVAVDEATGDVYVAEDERHVVSQFSPSDEWLGWITEGPAGALVEPCGVAVAQSGQVLVADAGTESVDVFGPGETVPDVKTAGASKIAKATAVLTGTIDGDGLPAKYHFQYGPSEAYGSVTPSLSAGTGEETLKVELVGLQAGASYHYRLVAENENGGNVGVDREFTTRPAVESLSTGMAEAIMPTAAKLTGTLNPAGVDTHYYFQWGTSTSYGNASPAPPGTDAGAGNSAVAVATELSDLRPNTTYHYRLVGSDSYGTTYGLDREFTTSGPPRITSESASGLGHEEATLNVNVDPDELETEYRFEYGETTAYGSEAPAGGGTLASGEAPVAVRVALSELKIGTTYHYRVVATNGAGTTAGPDRTFTTIPPALIEESRADNVTSQGATVEAQINPLGHDTTYYLQYGTEPCAGGPGACADLPVPPGTDIGSGQAPVPVVQQLGELEPSTTYHYRWIAINGLGTSEGLEQTLTTPAAATAFALPDGRAWEMVSPPNKHGAPIEALTREGGIILAAEDGDAITYVADGSIVEDPQGNRSPEQQQVLSRRGPDEWTSEDLATPNTSAQGVASGAAPEYQLFSPDLSVALVDPPTGALLAEPPLSPEARQSTIYLRNNTSGRYLPLVTESNVPPGTEFGGKLRVLGANAGLSTVVIESPVPLTASASGPGLYAWSSGKLQLISVLPSGVPANSAQLGYTDRVVATAVSTDGSRVVWANREESVEGAQRGHLYLRDIALGQTLELDAAKGVSEPARGSAAFVAASADGSRVFFLDKQRLTPDATAEPEQIDQEGKPDLYECQIVEEAGKLGCDLTDLTASSREGEPANVQGFILGVDEGGSSLYLVAHGVLTTNQNGNGETAEEGSDNLYWLHSDGSSWETTFVARLSTEDSPEWEGAKLADTAYLTARVSPDGRYFAFMSSANLTGYDNTDANSGKPDEEVYLYDSAANSLRCVSCNPTGERPVGVLDTDEAGEGVGLLVDRRKVWAEGHEHWLAGNIPGWTSESLTDALIQPRYLSDEGRLFFNSPDDLVPQATNHKEDVYEFEPSGVGSCVSVTGGCVSLISSGTSPRESAFLEATPSGDDVFFLTAARLVPQDTDTAFDVYDARVCSEASPCLQPPEPAPPGCSSANACRPAEPAVVPTSGPAGTAAYSGPGNAVSTPPPAQHQVRAAKTVRSAKPLTRAEKLARALAACKKLRSHKRRKTCEAEARRKYGARAKSTGKYGAKGKQTARKSARQGKQTAHTSARREER